MKKQFLILFAFISVLALSQVPQRFNKVIVTGDITSPKFIKTGSNADSVLLGNGSARAISTIKTDTVSLSNRINAKATGSGTASGTNTGDETLTSIKTKLGAATPVSDGYLRYQDFTDFADRVSNATHTGDATGSTALTLATVNSNVGTYNNITINAKGLATAGSNVSYEPSFSKNTAFNKNFGTTPGTVLEGRTFGTAAGSAVGDFIQNNNSSAQTANMWISGIAKISRGSFTDQYITIQTIDGQTNFYHNEDSGDAAAGYGEFNFTNNATPNSSIPLFSLNNATGTKFKIYGTGAATFSSTVNSTGFLLNGNNLTSSLTTNYIPKWNGSSMVNSLISDDGSRSGSTCPFIFKNTTSNVMFLGTYNAAFGGSASTTDGLTYVYGNNKYHIATNGFVRFSIGGDGNASIPSTTTSTSPTTGALVVSGGIGVGGNGYFAGDVHCGNIMATSSNSNFISSDVNIGYGSYQGYKLAVNGTGYFNGNVTASSFSGNGSNLTGIQLPITLTTNGTSGAATFSGNVLNVPNYASTGGVNQTQTTINGSVNGNAICSMPFQTPTYKKVIILLGSFSGSLTYTFPTPFLFSPNIYTGAPGISPATYSITTTSISLSGGSNTNGWVTLEGF